MLIMRVITVAYINYCIICAESVEKATWEERAREKSLNWANVSADTWDNKRCVPPARQIHFNFDLLYSLTDTHCVYSLIDLSLSPSLFASAVADGSVTAALNLSNASPNVHPFSLAALPFILRLLCSVSFSVHPLLICCSLLFLQSKLHSELGCQAVGFSPSLSLSLQTLHDMDDDTDVCFSVWPNLRQ